MKNFGASEPEPSLFNPKPPVVHPGGFAVCGSDFERRGSNPETPAPKTNHKELRAIRRPMRSAYHSSLTARRETIQSSGPK